MTAKAIFLDFDGVLINPSCYRKGARRSPDGRECADPACIAALNSITDATGASIVISSTWRIATPIADLRCILQSWSVTGKVIDKTPRLINNTGLICTAQPRGVEIQAWLDNGSRYDIESLVILDDDDDMGMLMPYLVKTTFENGLTGLDAKAAIGILNKRRPDLDELSSR